MSKYLIVLALAFTGCVPEVARLTEGNAQHCSKYDEAQEEFVEAVVTSATTSDVALPEWLPALVDGFLKDAGKAVNNIRLNTAALQSWVGVPEEEVRAGGTREKRDRASLTTKAKVKVMVENAIGAKMGKPPKPMPKPAGPTPFPWQEVGTWGLGALLAGGLGKKTLDARKSDKREQESTEREQISSNRNVSLVKAIARARANGGKETMDAALTGEGVPQSEIVDTRASFKVAKELGEV